MVGSVSCLSNALFDFIVWYYWYLRVLFQKPVLGPFALPVMRHQCVNLRVLYVNYKKCTVPVEAYGVHCTVLCLSQTLIPYWTVKTLYCTGTQFFKGYSIVTKPRSRVASMQKGI